MDRLQILKASEESLEEKLDRINVALQNTMHEIDVTANHTRGYSIISCLHSYTGSYCNLDAFDLESDKSEEKLPGIIEDLLQALDRAQMTIEDFISENSQERKKLPIDKTLTYIKSLEKENKELKRAQRELHYPIRNPKLEQERKNFEEKLAELDYLVSTYKTKHTQIKMLEDNLKTKESLLEQKEKQLKQLKNDLEKSKKQWEESVINNTIRYNGLDGKRAQVAELGIEEAPPPILAMSPNLQSDLQILQQNLRLHEIRYRTLADAEEQAKLVIVIDQLKNKIATLRGQQAMMDCRKSSKVMTDMKKTIEKEVNYEEYLRKSHLEKFSVKGSSGKGFISMTPSYKSLNSKRFLFEDDE